MPATPPRAGQPDPGWAGRDTLEIVCAVYESARTALKSLLNELGIPGD